MKHLFVLLTLLLTWGGAQAQTEKQTPVTKLPGEENLSLRERAERDFLMPVRRKKIVTEAPKTADDNTAAPESDATAHYSETADEAREAAVPAHTTRSYEVRHADWLAARRAAARREESRAEARAEARRAARHSSRSHSSKSKSSKSKAHKSTSHSSKAKSSKTKTKSKSASHSSKSKAKSSKAKTSHSTAKKSSSKKSTAHKTTKKKSTPSKSKSKSKKRR